MKYVAFVILRHDRRDLHRPFRVPIPDSMSILLLPPSLDILRFYLLAGEYHLRIYINLAIVSLERISKERGWCQLLKEPTPVIPLSYTAFNLDHGSPDESIDG